MKIYYYIIPSLILLLLIITIFLYFIFYNKEKFNIKENIQYMTKNDTIKFILSDNDNYIKKMSYIDLYARKCKNHKEYMNNVIECVSDFNNTEMNLLNKAVIKANNFFNNYNEGLIKGYEINKNPWIFSLTYNNNSLEYEEGLPHTRNNIIFLSKKIIDIDDNNIDNLISTLIHEKVHIFQRFNKKIMDEYIKNKGYYLVDYSKIDKERLLRRRINPDINDDIYYDDKEKRYLIFNYKNNIPLNISDVEENDYTLEHPYEKQAYEIGNKYLENIIY